MLAKRALLWLALLAVTIFAVWGISPRLEAQSELDEVLPARLEMLVYPPTEENSAELAAVLEASVPQRGVTSVPAYHLPHTTVVYENLEVGNWEIYKNTPEQERINLTQHPASDIHPRLNHNSTYVVFASNRDGNYEIYKMAVDGSQLTRLTLNGADDVKPAWSPDGTKIAFESYRDGQAEIYVMNADGSSQIRLTASPDFDGMPTWSPDGQLIAFSSRRTGGYRIYTMDSATGANQIQRSTTPYSILPAWSPDGNVVVYTTDRNNDEWLDIGLLDVTNEYELKWYEVHYGNATDLWASGWLPDSSGYTFSVLTYQYFQGSWYLVAVNARACILRTDNYAGYCRSFSHDDTLSLNPDVRSSDTILPILYLENLPAHLDTNTSHVLSWTATDIGIGVKQVNLEYRVGENGLWKSMGANEISSWSMPFDMDENVTGKTVYFRGRATDKYLARGDWSPIVQTSFYGWDIRGQLLDNRGQAVPKIPLNSMPSGLINAVTNQNGYYHTRATSLNPHHIETAGLPATTLEFNGRRNILHAYLPPSNNLMVNTDFEDGLAGWASSNTTPRLNGGYTGQAGVSLGEELASCTNCTPPQWHELTWWDDYEHTNSNRWFFDKMGQAHLFFDSNGQIYHTQQIISTGEWPIPTPLHPSALFPSHVIASQDGTIHVIAHNYYYQHKDGQWSEPEEIWDSSGYRSTTIFYVGVDNNDYLHLVRSDSYQGGVFHTRRSPNGAWTTPKLLSMWTGTTAAFVTPEGEIHLFSGTLRHSVFDQHKQLSEKHIWVEDPSHFFQWRSVLYFAENNSLILIGQGLSNRFMHYNKEDGWSKLMALPSELWNIAHTDVTSQATAVSINNGVASLFTMSAQSFEFEWLDNYTSEEYSVPSDNDSWGNLHLFRRYDGIFSHYGSHAITAVSDQTHTLAQVVTIPADMPHPTVSLMYRTVRDIPGDDTQFEVRLTNGTVTTTHVLSPTAVVWEHAWFDASEWAGETVTLTLAAVQRAGDPLLRVDVDDVSLGSAAPDTWLAVDATRAAMPNETFPVHLHYGNLSPDLLATTATLTLTLPAGLTVNSISVTPTVQTAEHLIWQLGDLPADSSGTISLTVTVNGNVPLMSTITATAELRTRLAEPSWANNAQTWPLFIGRRAYLPAIFR
jgi:hypothetical protein